MQVSFPALFVLAIIMSPSNAAKNKTIIEAPLALRVFAARTFNRAELWTVGPCANIISLIDTANDKAF
jgi:hypothetical protein